MFGIRPPFTTSESYSKKTLDLLRGITLGSNGARYIHRGIENRISKLQNPIFINLSLRDQLVANVTFCRRDKDWYVRYFAFHPMFQASTNISNGKPKERGFKKQLNAFFDNALHDENGPDYFYAYIDPKNDRSLFMSKNFGFKTSAKIATQTFSRSNPKKKEIEQLTDVEKIRSLVNKYFDDRRFYHPFQTFNETPFYTLKKNGEVVAFAKSHYAEWTIDRLPGKYGKSLTRIIPYLPRIRKIIQPRSHKFVAIDSVWVKDKNQQYFEELCEGILAEEQRNVIHWWVDKKDGLWQSLSQKVRWGLIHKINGIHEVDLVTRTNESTPFEEPIYVSGFDFI